MLAWLVRGAVEHYRHGLGKSRQVITATANYRQHEDVVARFLDECTIQITGRTKVKSLREAWVDWAKTAGTPIGRDQDFTDQLEAHGVELTTYQGARFASRVGLLSKSPGGGDLVTPRDPSAGNSPRTRAEQKVAGYGLTRPHEIDETAGQLPFDPGPTDEDLERWDAS